MVVKSDGNGGLIINKGAAVLLALLIAFLTASGTAMVTLAVTGEKVSTLTKHVDQLEPHVQENTERLVAVENDINHLTRTADSIERKLDIIDERLRGCAQCGST